MNKYLRIREVMDKKNISVSELARRMSITPGSVIRAIDGNPTIDYLARLSEAMHCKIKDLIK